MKISWDDIKYIFQIPLEWYKTIHERVFNAYGSNFIRVKDGYYGGLEIGIDFDEFSDSVNSCISGYVRTVDNISADEFGNVELSGYVKSVDNISADEDGNVNLSGYVKSVNNISADANGNVSVDVGVKTVNNTAPDANGNINVAVDTTSCLLKTDWMNVDSSYSVSPYVYSNTAYTGNLPAGVTNLYQWTGALTYQTLDDEITDLGYIKDEDLSDLVKSVNGIEPDEDGNVELSGYVKSVNGISSDSSGNVELSGYVKSVNGETPDQNGQVSVYVGVETVNNISPDANGNVNINSDYVDLSTAQNVAGSKTWEDAAKFNDVVTFANTATDTTQIHGASARFQAPVPILTFANGSSLTDVATISRDTTTSVPKHLMIRDQQRVEVMAGNANIMRVTSGGIRLISDMGVHLDVLANYATLANPPDGSANDAIATVGYCKANFLSAGNYVQTVNNTAPDANGNVDINVGVKTVNNNSPDANGNINITADTSTCLKYDDWMNVNSQHSVAPYVYSNTAYNGNLPGGVTNLYSWVGALTYQSLDAEIADLGYVNDEDLGDLAYMDTIEVDGHTSDANGAVSFGLTGDKWVKTDANGHLTTTNDTPVTVDTSQYTPVNVSNQKVVTDVTWNGTKLQYKYQNWTFVNGVLVSKSNEATQDIDTPTVITWA